MKDAKYILRQTAKILAVDVSHYRNVILNSGGGEFPPSIMEKKRLLNDIEKLIKISKNNPVE